MLTQDEVLSWMGCLDVYTGCGVGLEDQTGCCVGLGGWVVYTECSFGQVFCCLHRM